MTESLVAFGLVLALCFAGAPLALVTLLVGIGGFALVRGFDSAIAMAGQQTVDILTSDALSVIPLFILMGTFLYRANISDELYEAGHAMLGRFRGGLAMSTIAACAGFSAVCGSSLATSATMSRVALPSMRRYGYADSLSTGSIAAGGTLGIMIPPSVPMVIYGVVAEEDIGKLFIAGVVPGVLLVLLYLLAIAVTVRLRPSAGPAGEPASAAAIRRALLGTWPVLLLFALVLGGIYLGVFTPTEAAGVGAFGAFCFLVARGRVGGLAGLVACCADAARTSALIFAVAVGALVFANLINILGMPYALLDLVEALELGPVGLVVFIAFVCVVLGMVFESIGILLLIVPVFLPALHAAGVDLIWVGIMVIIVIEMGLITPPIGMNVFTVKSVVPDVSLGEIFRGVVPFIAADLVALLLILAFPAIALWLPALMR